MKIGITSVPVTPDAIDEVVEAERLGADTVWVPEFWGYDALTPLAAVAMRTGRIRLATGIAQLGSRTPAGLAMAALSLQQLSGGRFVLGIGTSGPQVIEGWHGVRFDRPVQRTRETIEIVRRAVSGERLTYDGELYQLPLPDSQGRALRAAAPPAEVPIHVASLGPRNLRLTGELADGWIGNSFFCESADVFLDEIRAGADAAGRSIDDIELSVSVGLEITDDIEGASRRHADGFAFTFGAMGSGSDNFYNNAFARQGWGDDVAEVQRLWQAGDRDAATARVPTEIGRAMNLIGPRDEIARRVRQYADAGIDQLRVGPVGDTMDERLATLGELMDIVAGL